MMWRLLEHNGCPSIPTAGYSRSPSFFRFIGASTTNSRLQIASCCFLLLSQLLPATSGFTTSRAPLKASRDILAFSTPSDYLNGNRNTTKTPVKDDASTIQTTSDLLAGNVTTLQANTLKFPKRPTFPKSTYHLSKDEDSLQFHFISFIDHSFFTRYSQVARLVEPRKYARPDQFEQKNRNILPNIDDVAPPPSQYGPLGNFLAWNRIPARAVVGGLAYLAFPPLIVFLEGATNHIDGTALITLVSTYLPGVSIVLGTYYSLTLSILYGRFARMQETVSLEASLLAFTFSNLLSLFANDKEAMVDGVQCIADQIGTLVQESRGRETMRVIYSDPYARILHLVQDRNQGDLDPQLVGAVRSSISELFRVRAKRMSDEGLALAPTHFDVMTFLSGLLLAGYALGTVATAQIDGTPSGISHYLFSALVVCYVIFYEMAYDLNRPYDGVYQLRRSTAAMHFLQIKQLISTHPDLNEVIDFEFKNDEEDVELEYQADYQNRKAAIWFD